MVLVGIGSVPLRQELGNRVVLRDGGEFELLHRIIVQFVYFDTYGVRSVRVGRLLRLAALVGRLEEHSALDSRSDIAGQIASDESSGGREAIEEVLILGKAGLEHGVGELDVLSQEKVSRDLGRSAGGYVNPKRDDVAQPGDLADAGRFLIKPFPILVIIISRNK